MNATLPSPSPDLEHSDGVSGVARLLDLGIARLVGDATRDREPPPPVS
jgi:hypothetical protein